MTIRNHALKALATLFGVLCGSALVVANGQAELGIADPSAVAADESLLIIEGLEERYRATLLQNLQLEEKVKNLLNANRELAGSLVVAKTELEDMGGHYKKALLNLELLSTDAFDGENGVKDRLIKAASTLRLVEGEKERLVDALVALTTAVEDYMQTATCEDGQAKENVKRTLRDADVAVGISVGDQSLDEKSLASAKVITVKKDFNLVVVNVGKSQGLLLGTPVKIHRKHRIVGSALVIDVRDSVSGAIILDMNDPSDSIMVDDVVKVDPKGV